MSTEGIATIAHEVIAINRTTARNAVEVQCKGVMRLVDKPVSLLGKAKDSLNFGGPLCKITDSLSGLGHKMLDQTEALLGNYERVSSEVIDWVSDRADTGVNMVNDNILSRGGPTLTRVFQPGLGLLRSVSAPGCLAGQDSGGLRRRRSGPAVVRETRPPRPGRPGQKDCQDHALGIAPPIRRSPSPIIAGHDLCVRQNFFCGGVRAALVGDADSRCAETAGKSDMSWQNRLIKNFMRIGVKSKMKSTPLDSGRETLAKFVDRYMPEPPREDRNHPD